MLPQGAPGEYFLLSGTLTYTKLARFFFNRGGSMRKMVMRLFFAVWLLMVQQSVLIPQAQCEPLSEGLYRSLKIGLAGYENARLEQSNNIQGADFLGNYFLSLSGGYS